MLSASQPLNRGRRAHGSGREERPGTASRFALRLKNQISAALEFFYAKMDLLKFTKAYIFVILERQQMTIVRRMKITNQRG